MSIRSIILLLSFFAVFITPIQGQDKDAVLYLQERLAAYKTAHPSNNLFLHLDKTVYAPEETIWFKAYLLADTSLEAKVLYVRIIDQEHTIMADLQFPVYDVRAHGSIELFKPGNTRHISYREFYDPPRIFMEGDYTLYAYTDRMVSLNDTNVFVQPIRIRRATGKTLQAEATVMDTARLEKGGEVQVKVVVRSGGTPVESVEGEYQLLSGGKELKLGRLTTNVMGEAFVDFVYPNLPDDQSLQLKMLFTREDDDAQLSLHLPHRSNPLTVNGYPEGGTLAAGGRVSVEVLDINGHPVSTSVLVKQGGETVDSLHTDEQGMAVWEVPAVTGAQYTLITENGRGKQELRVPSSEQGAGYLLKLYNDTAGCRAVIWNDGAAGEALLVLRSLDEMIWSHSVEVLPGDSVMLELPVHDLPKGIWNLSLFDGNNRLRAERLFMNKQTDDYQVMISTEQQEYGPRKRVQVRIQVTDAAGHPVIANLSVSATEKNRLDSTLFRDIRYSRYSRAFAPGFHHRLLAAHPAGLDGLLLGRHWVHDRWNTVLSDTSTGPPVRIPHTDRTSGIAKIFVWGRSPNYSLIFNDVKLRSANEVVFINYAPKPEPLVTYRTLEADWRSRAFSVPDSLLHSRKGQEWELDIERYWGDSNMYRYLVKWQDPDIAFDSTVVRSGLLHRHKPLNRFTVATISEAPAFDFQGVNVLQEVTVGGTKEKPIPRGLRMCNCEWYEAMMKKDLNSILVADRKFEKGVVYHFGWYYGSRSRFIRYLGCGRYRDIEYIRNITIPEKFLLPDYDQDTLEGEDPRSTIYWSPNIMTDEDGTATFSFFTSDTAGEFAITAQGLALHTLIPMMGKAIFKVTATGR